MPREVSSIGIDVSERYAKDKRDMDTSIVQQAGSVAALAKVKAAIPSFIPEADALLDTGIKQITWALFGAPHGFFEGQSTLFSSQIAPRLGSHEHLEELCTRIKTLPLPEESADWHKQKERVDLEKQKLHMSSALEILKARDKDLLAIKAAREQYHKG